MAVTLFKKRWHKITAITLLVFTVLVLVAAVIANRYWSPILAKRVKSELLKSTDSLYKVDFSKAELHILRGEIVIYDIKLSPDTAVYNLKKKQAQAPNTLYELRVKRLVVSHIHPFTLYFKNKLNINRITLTSPELQLSSYPNQKKDTTVKDKRTLWQKLSKTLKLVHVGEIFLNDINFKYKNYTGEKPAVSELKEMNLKATDLLIDSATQADSTRLLYCKDITTMLYNYSGKSTNGLYTYKVKSVKLSTQTSTVSIVGLDLKPISPPMFFDESRADRFTLHLDSIELNKFDYLNYHQKQSFKTSSITVSNGSFSVYSNPNGLPQKTDRVVTFPHVGIKAIKAGFNIDTLILKHIDVYYNQFNKKSGQKGYIAFNNTNGKFLNITNNKDSLAKNNLAKASVSSYFMGRGKFDLTFIFNLTDAQNSYSYKGHLGPMDLSRINPATMPLSMVKITSGKVKSLDFDIRSTNKISTGKVTLLYNNLKINLLKTDTLQTYKRKALASFFVNALIIKHDNPDDGQTVPRSANVVFHRPPNYPFFRTVWLTILSGIKPCAGVGEAKEKQAMKQMDEHEKKKLEKERKKAEKERKKAAEKLKEAKDKARKERMKRKS